MSRPVVGQVPGFSYEIAPASEPSCSFCEREGLPVLKVNAKISICEPCSTLAAWVWRDYAGLTVAGAAYPLDVRFVLVLIVRERLNDFMHPFDVLMVERKDEQNAYGLPGGKVDRGEEPAAAAARELAEEVDVRTWPAALEPIHAAYSPRASLGTVFLCRGYDGDPVDGVGPEGQKVRWQPWPPGEHARHLAGFYTGVELAFDMRWRMHRQVQAGTPLSLRLGEPAVNYLLRKLAQLRGEKKVDDGRMLDSWTNVMTDEEKGICEVILAAEQKVFNAQAGLVATEAAKAAAGSASVMSGDDEDLEDDNAPPEDEGEEDGQQGLGFVRPAPPRRPPL
jgi:8-oxo-dGTP pyrophosphatase MutT (NUDIX family)